jgi:hypothetical protein
VSKIAKGCWIAEGTVPQARLGSRSWERREEDRYSTGDTSEGGWVPYSA